MSWKHLGKCVDEDPVLWFPEGGYYRLGRRPEGQATVLNEQAAQAVEICHLCPVQIQCLRYALEQREVDGIWGGTLPDERKRMVRLSS